MRHLARALELNPDSRDSLRKEPELEALRETTEIRAILAAPPAPPREGQAARMPGGGDDRPGPS